MKRIQLFFLFAICIIISTANPQYHEISNSVVPFYFYIRSMPAYYRSMTSIDILADSLKSSVEITRIRAAYRMAELKNPTAIPLLIKAYENEPLREPAMDMGNGLRDYSLVAIGIIGGNTAEKYLCELAEEIFFNRGFSWSKGDAIYIAGGLIDGLSMTQSDCAESLLSRLIEWYENQGRPSATLEVAYIARNRLQLLKNETQSQKSSLLDEFKVLKTSVKMTEDTASSREYYYDSDYTIRLTKSKALQDNAIEIGTADPQALQEYKNGLAADDPFRSEIEHVIEIANKVRNRQLQ